MDKLELLEMSFEYEGKKLPQEASKVDNKLVKVELLKEV